MSDFLALEWDHDQISGVHAHVSGGRARIRRAFVLPRPSVAVAGSGPLPVAWLQTQLAERGISGGDVLVTLPRDEVVVKRIELPETSDDELPVLVRFQAAAKSSVPLDELSLDFIPLPRRNEVPGREVLMATVPQQTLTEIRLLCENAGLKLQKVGLTPAVVAELVARAEPPASEDLAGASLVVSQHGNRLEISVLRRSHLLFSHSSRLPSESAAHDPQMIVPEVSRSLVALRGAIPDVKIERAWTLLDAASHNQIAEVLRRRLSCDVQPIDAAGLVEWDLPIESGVDPTLFTGPIGLALSKADPRVPAVDFLAPRQPPVKRDLRKRKMIMLGAGAGVLVALLAGNFWLQLRGLDSEIDDLIASKNQLTEDLKKGAPVAKSADLIDQWEKSGVSWIDQLSDLTARMPATDRIYLKRLELHPRTSSLPPKVKLEAYARDRADVLGLSDKLLAADERYRLSPPTHRSSNDDQYYAWFLNGEISLVDPPKQKGKGGPAAKPAQPPTSAEKPPEKPAEAAAAKGAVPAKPEGKSEPADSKNEKAPAEKPPADKPEKPAGQPAAAAALTNETGETR